MKRWFAGLIFLVASHVWADDPCAAIGIAGTYNRAGSCDSRSMIYPFEITTIPVPDRELLARLINNQVGLRADLKIATDKLTAAVDALAKVSMVLVENNDKWQKATLNQTINAINAMPTKLAEEKALQTVLLAIIKEQLLKDSGFLDAVKKSP